MLETKNLRKEYKSKDGVNVAVNNLNIRCEEGEIYCLLGSNGAGKTTTLRMLTTLLKPTSGDAYVNNLSVKTDQKKIRENIGYVSYETKVDEYLTPREIAYYFGHLNEVDEDTVTERIEYFSKILDMRDFLDTQTRKFSTGMNQKTTILRALIHNPKVIILDEPTSGLDILTGKSVTDYLKILKSEGKSILFSTHILWEAEKIADKIGIIHKGNLIDEGSFEYLKDKYKLNDLEDIFFKLAKDE